MESEDESLHSSKRREHVEMDESDCSEASQQSSDAVLDAEQAEHVQAPAEAATAITADAMAERESKMFVVGAAGPVASGLRPLAGEVNKAIVKLAAAHMDVKDGMKRGAC